MDHNRREFVKSTAWAGAGAALIAVLPSLPKVKPMKILILGGTAFLGPQIVEAATARGHVLTLFYRGKTNPGLFPDIEKLHGDRDGDLKSLEARMFHRQTRQHNQNLDHWRFGHLRSVCYPP